MNTTQRSRFCRITKIEETGLDVLRITQSWPKHDGTTRTTVDHYDVVRDHRLRYCFQLRKVLLQDEEFQLPVTYEVVVDGEEFSTCTCPGFTFHKPKFCKHIQALTILVEKGKIL